MEQLTDSQINLIVESLLFGACLEVTDSWTVEDRNDMLNLAIKFKQTNTSLKNIQIHNYTSSKEGYENNICNSIIKHFSNIAVVSNII